MTISLKNNLFVRRCRTSAIFVWNGNHKRAIWKFKITNGDNLIHIFYNLHTNRFHSEHSHKRSDIFQLSNAGKVRVEAYNSSVKVHKYQNIFSFLSHLQKRARNYCPDFFFEWDKLRKMIWCILNIEHGEKMKIPFEI